MLRILQKDKKNKKQSPHLMAMYRQSALPPLYSLSQQSPVSHLFWGSTNSNFVSSLLIRESRWNRELCVERDHFVLKFFIQMKHSCSLLWISECRDAMWRRSAFIDCRRRLQKLQINGAAAPVAQSSLGAPPAENEDILINNVIDSCDGKLIVENKWKEWAQLSWKYV